MKPKEPKRCHRNTEGTSLIADCWVVFFASDHFREIYLNQIFFFKMSKFLFTCKELHLFIPVRITILYSLLIKRGRDGRMEFCIEL